MLTSIDTLLKRPQIRIMYVIIVDCRGATVGDRGSMAWMPAYITVPNLLSMISMICSDVAFDLEHKLAI
jgi:hypothetical protein